jgi:hypothetical protein
MLGRIGDQTERTGQGFVIARHPNPGARIYFWGIISCLLINFELNSEDKYQKQCYPI